MCVEITLYPLGHVHFRNSVAAKSSAQTFSPLNARSSNDYEDHHRHCGGLGHGSRPRVRSDRHNDTTRYNDAAWHNHDASGYEHATGNNYHPTGYDHATGHNHYPVRHNEPAERDRYHRHDRNDG